MMFEFWILVEGRELNPWSDFYKYLYNCSSRRHAIMNFFGGGRELCDMNNFGSIIRSRQAPLTFDINPQPPPAARLSRDSEPARLSRDSVNPTLTTNSSGSAATCWISGRWTASIYTQNSITSSKRHVLTTSLAHYCAISIRSSLWHTCCAISIRSSSRGSSLQLLWEFLRHGRLLVDGQPRSILMIL